MNESNSFNKLSAPRNRLMYFITKKGISIGDVRRNLSMTEEDFHAMMSARFDPSLLDARRLCRMLGEPMDILFPSEYENDNNYRCLNCLSTNKESRFLCLYNGA